MYHINKISYLKYNIFLCCVENDFDGDSCSLGNAGSTRMGGKEMGNNWQVDAYTEDRISRYWWRLNVECDKDKVSSRTPRFLAGSAEHMVSFALMEMTRREWEGSGGMKKGREERDKGREVRRKEGRMGMEREWDCFQRRLLFVSFGACFGI